MRLMSVKLEVGGHLKLKRQLALLKLPAAKRKRILGQIGRQVRTQSRKRLRSQTGLDGKPWEARKQGNKKMLRGLSKRLAVFPGADRVTITFKNTLVGRIARAQQEGVTEVMTRARMQQRHGQPDYAAPATRGQARQLREAGFTIPRGQGRGRKRPTLKWVTQNLTFGQAGAVLRALTDKPRQGRWLIPLPARSFLGATQHDIDAFIDRIFEQTFKQATKG
ncbi:phage virion morphogenesis protein [Hahella sp. HN01]|nr:phage virion morphogenesis protein [Hahella sp. HN01]